MSGGAGLEIAQLPFGSEFAPISDEKSGDEAELDGEDDFAKMLDLLTQTKQDLAQMSTAQISFPLKDISNDFQKSTTPKPAKIAQFHNLSMIQKPKPDTYKPQAQPAIPQKS